MTTVATSKILYKLISSEDGLVIPTALDAATPTVNKGKFYPTTGKNQYSRFKSGEVINDKLYIYLHISRLFFVAFIFILCLDYCAYNNEFSSNIVVTIK